MTDTTPNDYDSQSITDILRKSYPNFKPVVRYASPDESGVPKQEPILRSIHDNIPEGVKWVSGIYLISDAQRDQLNKYADNPYANPDSQNIAHAIQNECEGERRVLYPIHAESDAYEKDGTDPVSLPTMIDWLQRWVREVIDKVPDEGTFYYSGNRSIHVHIPLFVTGENLRWLKDRTQDFCDMTGAELDAGVYKKKQQFRLPGVVHDGNGVFRKVEVGTDWTREEMMSAATNNDSQSGSYADILDEIFHLQDTPDLAELLLSSVATEIESQSQSSSVLSTWPSRYLRPKNEQKRAYRAKEFYPYPTGEDHDGRSVAALRVVDDPFEKKAGGSHRTFVPCFFYGAHSCSGREYTKNQHYAPLQLSRIDARNWDFEEGETLVIIGGGNYQSIILTVEESVAQHVGGLLDPEDGERDDALCYLEAEGFEVGSAGASRVSGVTSDHQPPEQTGGSGSEEPTPAEQLQRKAEQGDVEISLEHGERRDVANRLLTIGGWDYAWQWFREQYGNDFSPQRTWRAFESIIQTFPEDFADVDLPPEP
jgi:hypothetical protein